MRRCHLFLLMVSYLNILFAADLSKFADIMINTTVTYQIAYSQIVKPIPISHAIDINGCFFFINGGYNYEINRDHKIYFGGGYGHILQLQMGYGFTSDAFILRWRQDSWIPSRYYSHFPIFGRHRTLNRWMEMFSFGYYLEYKFIKGCGFSGGITIGMRLYMLDLYNCHQKKYKKGRYKYLD